MKGKIFNAQEVQAMLNGSKVMFREVVDKDNLEKIEFLAGDCDGVCETENLIQRTIGDRLYINSAEYPEEGSYRLECPYQVGQKIFCKESFAVSNNLLQDIKYLADNQKKFGFISNDFADWKKRPAQHMKQEHSRLTLLIKEIKVERLASISEEDAIAEGFFKELDIANPPPVEKFSNVWNATHKKPEEKFEANPWVFVYQFEIINNSTN